MKLMSTRYQSRLIKRSLALAVVGAILLLLVLRAVGGRQAE